MSSEEAKVIEVLKQNPSGLAATQIVKLSGLKKAQVLKILEGLASKGVIAKTVKGCRVTYKVKG